jgi:hypothetical protein
MTVQRLQKHPVYITFRAGESYQQTAQPNLSYCLRLLASDCMYLNSRPKGYYGKNLQKRIGLGKGAPNNKKRIYRKEMITVV